jgi:hypothetical protein
MLHHKSRSAWRRAPATQTMGPARSRSDASNRISYPQPKLVRTDDPQSTHSQAYPITLRNSQRSKLTVKSEVGGAARGLREVSRVELCMRITAPEQIARLRRPHPPSKQLRSRRVRLTRTGALILLALSLLALLLSMFWSVGTPTPTTSPYVPAAIRTVAIPNLTWRTPQV